MYIFPHSKKPYFEGIMPDPPTNCYLTINLANETCILRWNSPERFLGKIEYEFGFVIKYGKDNKLVKLSNINLKYWPVFMSINRLDKFTL